MNKHEIVKDVIENGYRKVNFVDANGKNRKVALDSFTSGAINNVFNYFESKGDKETYNKLLNMNWLKLQSIAFKACK